MFCLAGATGVIQLNWSRARVPALSKIDLITANATLSSHSI